jgi:hypothetical protein
VLQQVLRPEQRLVSLVVQLPAAINASAAASSILQQAQQLLAPPKKPAPAATQQQQQQQQQQDEQQGRDQQQQQQQNAPADAEQSEWQPEFQESHLVSLGPGWRAGRGWVETVDAAAQLTDVWFASNTLMVLLLPAAEQAAAAAASPPRSGSKRRQPEPDMEDAVGQKYMLVWSSELNDDDTRLLPVLLPMPEGPGKHDAAAKAFQVSSAFVCKY